MATKSGKIHNREKIANSDDLPINGGRKKLQSKPRAAENNLHNSPDLKPQIQKSHKNGSSGPRYSFSTEIPEYYNETYIRAIPRNPECLFVYWELSDSSLDNLKSKLGNDIGESVLKIEEWNRTASALKNDPATQSHNKVSQIDMPLRPPIYHVFPSGLKMQHSENMTDGHFQDSSYIRVPEPGKEYIVEYGQLVNGNAFLPLSKFEPNRQLETVTAKNISENATPENDLTFISNSEIVQTTKKVTHLIENKSKLKTRYLGSASLD